MLEAWRLKGYELEPWRVAYHEAGHALMVVLVRRALYYVTIAPFGKLQGHASYRKTNVYDREMMLAGKIQGNAYRKEICIGIAGPFSEIAAMCETEVPFYCENDLEVARAFINIMTARYPEVAQIAANDISLEVHQMLKENWRIVEDLVSALLDQETLSGRRVREIVKRRRQ